MVVVAEFMLEGSADRSFWTGDRVLGEHAALCVCRWAGGLETGGIRCLSRRGREKAKKAKSTMAKLVCLECIMNMNILEDHVVSLLSSLSS